jgi:foldase protein PrsA
MILCKDIRSANEVWEELRKNPAGFDKLAKERSTDTSTRASGGVLPEPIARHAVPRDVTDSVFTQLVDGDPKDTNPAHKPKDGDFTGPIQLNEAGWMIIRREEVIPGKGAGKGSELNDPNVRNMLKAQMFDVKLNAAMSTLFEDLMKDSSIDNKLTGQVKMAREEEHPDFKAGLDSKVQRMSAAGETQANPPAGRNITGPTSPTAPNANRPPAGVPPGAAATANQVQQTIRTAPRTAPPGN